VTADETKRFIKAFEGEYRGMTPMQAELWTEAVKGAEFGRVMSALRSCRRGQNFAPSVQEFLTKYLSVQNERANGQDRQTDGESLNTLLKRRPEKTAEWEWHKTGARALIEGRCTATQFEAWTAEQKAAGFRKTVVQYLAERPVDGEVIVPAMSPEAADKDRARRLANRKRLIHEQCNLLRAGEA